MIDIPIPLPFWLERLIFRDFYRELEAAAMRHKGMTVTRSRTYAAFVGAFTLERDCVCTSEEEGD
jgi:hypothetical protein